MEALDGTVIVTALPAIAAAFGVTTPDARLGVTVYLVAIAVCVPDEQARRGQRALDDARAGDRGAGRGAGGIGAGRIEGAARGDGAGPGRFPQCWIGVGLLMTVATALMLRLDEDAGAAMSRRR